MYIFDWISIPFILYSHLNAVLKQHKGGSSVIFMGEQGGLNMCCAWPDFCCLSEAAGSAGGVKSSRQVCRKSEETKTEDVASDENGWNFPISPFGHPFLIGKALFSPLHSFFPLYQERILGAPPQSEWGCCRPSPWRAQRGCTAAACFGLNCVEWEKHRPTRKITNNNNSKSRGGKKKN